MGNGEAPERGVSRTWGAYSKEREEMQRQREAKLEQRWLKRKEMRPIFYENLNVPKIHAACTLLQLRSAPMEK